MCVLAPATIKTNKVMSKVSTALLPGTWQAKCKAVHPPGLGFHQASGQLYQVWNKRELLARESQVMTTDMIHGFGLLVAGVGPIRGLGFI